MPVVSLINKGLQLCLVCRAKFFLVEKYLFYICRIDSKNIEQCNSYLKQKSN